jgi:hypothetical protein
MARIVVGTFPSREHAEAARHELAAEGLGREEHARAERTTLASIIGNVFSGLIPPPPYARAIEEARQRGRWTLAIRGLDSESAARARSLIGDSGGADVHEGEAPDDDDVGTLVAVFGPDGSVLPGSPVGWDQAWTRDTAPATSGAEPFRPHHDVEDAQGLGTRDGTSRPPPADGARRRRG